MAKLRGQERAQYVAQMFGRISRRYDLLNTVMTGGRHYAWRHMATDMAVGVQSGMALDIATGTGDFAFDLARKRNVPHVVGLDFTPEMLILARKKAQRQGISGKISLSAGDAHALPFKDNSFICTTVGFGIRNFIDVPRALNEMTRVVKPGGRVVILEIVRLEGNGIISKTAPVYFRNVMPVLGSLLAGDREAYTYLPESVEEFLSASQLAELMRQAGLIKVTYHKLALGTVAILVGEKE